MIASFAPHTEKPKWVIWLIWAIVGHYTDKKTHFLHIFESFCPCTDPLWLKWVKWLIWVILCILALRRTQNLGERLVRAKITSDTDLEPCPTICLRGKLALKYTLTKCPRHWEICLSFLNDNWCYLMYAVYDLLQGTNLA